jgi:hypothetical protein
MVEPGPSSVILWDTLKVSAHPLQGRSGILVVAQVGVRETGQKGAAQYRVNFELNRHHGLISHDTEVLVSGSEREGLSWRYSGRRDVVVAVKDRFLTTQLYAHVAGQLGWTTNPSIEVVQSPLDP